MQPPEIPAAPAPTAVPGRRSSKPAVVGASIVLVFAGLFVVGLVPKLRQKTALAAAARAESDAITVRAVQPKKSEGGGELVLPGNVQALRETTLFARTSGYVKKRLVDIGDAVKAGDVLAEIETPELDQEIRQAQASLGQARAGFEQARTSLDLAKLDVARFEQMTPEGIASQRDLDQKRAAFRVAQANLAAAEAAIRSQQANVQRLSELKGFAKITAPFAGTVTARMVEVGALVTPGNGQSQGLFRVAEVETLRVFVNVPQSAAPGIRQDQEASVTIREYPGKTFAGKVTRTARSIDPSSRTMLVELQIPNADRAILPGSYAQARIAGAKSAASLRVPTAALVFTPNGPAVGVVGEGDRVHFAQVQLGTDYGSEIEIASGLTGGERIIANPSGALTEGAQVAVSAPPAPAASPTAKPEAK